MAAARGRGRLTAWLTAVTGGWAGGGQFNVFDVV